MARIRSIGGGGAAGLLALAAAALAAGCGVVTVATVVPIVDSMGGSGGASANSPPTVDAVTVTSAPVQPNGPHGDIVELRFTLADAESEPASVEVLVEVPADALADPARRAQILAPLDADGRFRATLTADSPALDGLAASPQGVAYSVRWRSGADVVNLAGLRVRVVPSGGGGGTAGDLSELIDIVNDLPRLTGSAFAPAEVGVAYDSGPAIEGGIPPYTLEVPDGQRPRGLAVVGARLVGTPERAGFFTIDFTVTDSVGTRVTSTGGALLTVAEPLRLASPFIPLGTPGQTDFSYTLPVRGGQGAPAFSLETIVSATLDYQGSPGNPAPVAGEALEIDSAESSPALLGRARVAAVDGDGEAGRIELAGLGIRLSAGQTIRGLTSGCTATVTAFARDPAVPERFVTGLPDGLALDPATGRIHGACPDESTLRALFGGLDDFLVRIRATDALGASAARNYVLRVRRTFEASRSLPLPLARYTTLALGDWDGDGDGDVILSPVSTPETHHLRHLENQGALGIVPSPPVDPGFADTSTIRRIVNVGDLDGVLGDDALVLYPSNAVELVTGTELRQRATTGLVSFAGTLASGPLGASPAALELVAIDLDGGAGGESPPERLLLIDKGSQLAVFRCVLAAGSGTVTSEPAGIVVGGDATTLGGAATIALGGEPALALAFPGRLVVAAPSLPGGGEIASWAVTEHAFSVSVDQVDTSGASFQVDAAFTPTGLVAIGGGDAPPLLVAGSVEGLSNPPRVEGAAVLRFDPSAGGGAGAYVLASFLPSTGASETRRNPARPAVADLDADGALDLVIPLPGERTVALVFGPVAALPARVPLAGALRVPTPAQCDLVLPGIHDGDGRPQLDLLLASSAEPVASLRQMLTLARNIGVQQGFLPQRLNAPSIFLTGSSGQVGEGAAEPFLAIDDFDGDGLNDLLVQKNELRSGSGTSGTTEGRGSTGGGSSTFSASVLLFQHEDASGGAEQSPDGDDAFAESGADTIVETSAGGGNSVNTVKRSDGAFAGLIRLGFASGDLDGDGRAEICLSTVDGSGAPVVTVRGVDEGGTVLLAELRTEPALAFAHLALADLADQDDVLPGAPNAVDVVGIAIDGDGAPVLESFAQRAPDGGGLRFERLAAVPLDGVVAVGDLVVADFTGDGVADVCVTLVDPALGPEVGLLPGLGEPAEGAVGPAAIAFGPLTRFALPTAGPLAEIIAGDAVDADNDGDLDLVLLVIDTIEDDQGALFRVATVHTVENEGAGLLIDRGRKVLLPVLHDRALAVRDLNGDGDFDVAVLGSGEAARLTILLGGGDGSFVQSDSVIVGRQAASMQCADLDRDGVPDFAIFTEAFDELVTISSDGHGRLVRWTR